jgi:hypothetical protein
LGVGDCKHLVLLRQRYFRSQDDVLFGAVANPDATTTQAGVAKQENERRKVDV